eukprot:6214408-Pleurochrysis_carterae.AAC.1
MLKQPARCSSRHIEAGGLLGLCVNRQFGAIATLRSGQNAETTDWLGQTAHWSIRRIETDDMLK